MAGWVCERRVKDSMVILALRLHENVKIRYVGDTRNGKVRSVAHTKTII